MGQKPIQFLLVAVCILEMRGGIMNITNILQFFKQSTRMTNLMSYLIRRFQQCSYRVFVFLLEFSFQDVTFNGIGISFQTGV